MRKKVSIKKFILYKAYDVFYGIYRMSIWKLSTKEKRRKEWPAYSLYADKIDVIEEYVTDTVPRNKEEREIFHYIQTKGITNVFPYDFIYNYYFSAAVRIFYDSVNDMFYFKRKGRRLYVKQDEYSLALAYYKNLSCEQDKRSPHKYAEKKLQGDILIDCGAAEGIFALDNIDNFEHIYLFEADESWIKALNMTFEKYRDKVKIIHKYVSNVTELSEKEISLDLFAEQTKIDTNANIYIKIDVEGAELSVLRGSTRILSECDNLKLAVCTYHKQDDEQQLKKELEKYNKFYFSMSKGYMVLYYADDLQEPFLRRGVLRVRTSEEEI